MSDLKKFLEREGFSIVDVLEGQIPDKWEELPRDVFMASNPIAIMKKDLGSFFWGELIEFYKKIKYTNKEIGYIVEIYLETKNMELIKDLPQNTDRLLIKYLLACLGESKVKELIKGLEK